MDLSRKEIMSSYLKVGRLHGNRVEGQLKHNNIGIHRAQHRMLMILANENCGSQKELAEKMNLSPATITVSMQKLEKEGYVKRTVVPGDNRYNKLAITEKGKAMVEKSMEVFVQVDEECFDGFTDEECAQLTKYLDRMAQNLTKRRIESELYY